MGAEFCVLRSVGVLNELVEIECSTELSDYIVENYKELIDDAKKFVDISMVENLVHDMYVAMKQREMNGNGYVELIGDKGDVITPRMSIYGYMKAASKNKKYQRLTEAPDHSTIKEIPCSVCAEELEVLTIGQRAFANMSSVDDIESVEQQQDLIENMQYLVSYEFNSPFKYSVITVLHKVLEVISTDDITTNNEMIASLRVMKPFEGADEEFVDAFKSVVMACARDTGGYKRALNKVIKHYEELGSVLASA